MNYLLFVIMCFLCLSACAQREWKRKEMVVIERVRSNYNHYLARNGIHETYCRWEGFPTRFEKGIMAEYSTNRFRIDSVEKARIFFCLFHDAFVGQFNAKREIRPFLHDFPLGPKNADLCIYFYNDKGEELESPYMALVGNRGNRVYYTTYDCKTHHFTTIHEEPFDVAHEICIQSIAPLLKAKEGNP
jgi:hypothetical protein